MRRRDFVLLGGACVLTSSSAWAQQDRIPTIGFLSPADVLLPSDKAFLQGLQDLGYIEGKTILMEYRFAHGKFERLWDFAAELALLNVDVIVARVTQASLAAKKATGSIPIVMLAVSDPIGSGLVDNLARPNANVTGTASMNAEVVGKSLEILKEVVPGASRVAVLWNPGNAVFQQQSLSKAERAAEALALELRAFGAQMPEEIEGAFAAMTEAQVDALLVLGDPVLVRYQGLIIEQAEKNRLPAIYATRESAEAGGLMAYGPNMEAQFRRAAVYVDKILKGAAPADLPVEQPTQFELVVNLNAAEALGLTFPLPILARADEVIE
jgi:putative tryptophan/tyrosine transport system substrate-binding protein